MMDAEALDATPSPSSPVSAPERSTTMNNHTDQDAREAREWAEYITSVRELHGNYAPQARAAARFILDNTTPTLPDPMFLAKATHPEYGEGIVISHYPDVDGYVRFIFPNEAMDDGTRSRWVDTSTLTFHTPDHPVFLETEEDYRSAPEGTIVAEDDFLPCILTNRGWEYPPEQYANHSDMAGIRRRVLRRGWEA